MEDNKMKAEEPVLKMMKRWTVGRWVSLAVMAYTYLVGELSHFLLGIVSRPMSQELHYGDKACLPNPQATHQSSDCRTLNFSRQGTCRDCREMPSHGGTITTEQPWLYKKPLSMLPVSQKEDGELLEDDINCNPSDSHSDEPVASSTEHLPLVHLLFVFCYDLLEGDNVTMCVWDYSGLGMEYQVLAGPAFIFVFTTAGIIIGIISDKFNRKVVVMVCCAVLTLATGLTGAASSYWHLVILRMLMGAGESSFAPACSSMISDMFPESLRALALGIFNWGIYLGYGLSYAVGNFITAADIGGLGWRWSYIVTGMMGVVATLLLFILVTEPPRGGQLRVKLGSEEADGKNPGTNQQQNETEFSNEDSKDITSSPNSQSREDLITDGPKLVEGLKSLLTPPVLMLAFASCLRHTAGFSWAYNTQLYFLTYYPDFNLGLWVTGVSIIGGTLGVAIGGLVSDKLVKRIGMRARLYVLAGSQLVATPFAAGVLFLPPPGAFFSLLGAYLFAEMWFGVLFAVLLELVSESVQSVGLAIFLFIMNNVGGNLPVLVDPLTNLTSYRTALLIMYPGGYLASAVMFFLTSFFVR